jgi:putative hydrolase of the HAD superfamily
MGDAHSLDRYMGLPGQVGQDRHAKHRSSNCLGRHFQMTNARAVLIDLDGTLCDYEAAKETGLTAVAAKVAALGVAPAAFLSAYAAHEPALFRAFASGALRREDYRRRRFRDALLACGLEVDPEIGATLNETYMSIANTRVHPFPDVLPALRKIRALGVKAVVLTNGPTDGQKVKMRALGLTKEVDECLTSEQLGSAKPDPMCFLKAAAVLGLEVRDLVMVGDSVDDDIVGAQGAGIRAVLIDRNDQWPTFQGERVRSLHEVISYIAIEEKGFRS